MGGMVGLIDVVGMMREKKEGSVGTKMPLFIVEKRMREERMVRVKKIEK